MQVIVTRPAAQAAAWVRELQVLGQPAHALPLIDIGPVADAAPVRAAWQQLNDLALVMFVSANAVAHFFARAPAGTRWPGAVRTASTGPGTSAALLGAGVPAACIVEPAAAAGRFDSEALWAQLASEDWAGRQVLVVRGEEGRDWLADTLRSHGARVGFVAAYCRHPPRLGPAGEVLLAQALAEPAAYLWHFSSSEAVGHLRGLAAAADWSASGALASHPRIVQAARDAGFGRVQLAGPSPEAVAQLAAQWPPIQSAP
jgi:uroporphyrinogen-III synthase